jgi:DNA segregation ATPase FtsK/SpoIIIE, S-DNA-T family
VVAVGVSVRRGPFHFHGVWALAVLGVGWLLRLVVVGARRPRLTVGAGAGAWLLVAHTVATVAGLLLVAHGLEVWALAHPVSWRRWGRPLLLGWWRRLWLYRRLWRRAMHAAGLEQVNVDGALERPRLGRVRSLQRVDVVAVRGLLGQRFAMWEEAAPMIAHTVGASDVRVHRGDDRRLTLELVRARRGRSWNRADRLELEDAW